MREPASTYTIEDFVADAREVMAECGDDRARVIERLRPLVERVVRDERLFDERYRAEPENGRPRHVYYGAPDGSLQIYMVEFAPGQPTPVHDHVTWGIIGVCRGKQRTTRYRRLDDGSQPGRAVLEVIEDTVLEQGAVYPLMPPDDIHRIETVGAEPSYSLHVLGADLSRQHRHIFDPERGTVEAVTGRTM